jgi:carbon-monoxide dehydrogenase medium subunit
MQVPAHVEYEKATSVQHALNLLARFGPEARILAGGHSLIPMMKLRLAQPETLIDINALTDLRYIRATAGELRIGAMTRHADLLSSALAGQHFAILHDAERVIADPIVRLWGTVGGSLCQADPSEDLSAAFAALKATMVIASLDGTRMVSARQFHIGPFETVVEPGEILTEIRIAIEPGGGSAYEKVGRRVGDWPVGAAGAAVWLDGAGAGAGGSRAGDSQAGDSQAGDSIREARIGLTAVGAEHFSAAAAEEFLRGAPASEESYARAGQIAAEHCHPVSDQRGPAEYKRHLACELTVRALRRAVARAAAGPGGVT